MSRNLSLVLAFALLVACANADSVDTSSPTGSTSGATTTLGPSADTSTTQTDSGATSSSAPITTVTYLAFADSWPAGEHCGGCTPFPKLWVEDLESQTGLKVQLINLMGYQERSPETLKTSVSLLSTLRSDEFTRLAVGNAEVILISTGGYEMEAILAPLQDGTCGGPDGFDCIRSLGEEWHRSFDEILTEIETLREGAPTAIRLVNDANPFLSVPQVNIEGMPEDFALTGGALILELLTAAMCDAAAEHGAVCVDVRPILNGPNLDQPVDENSPESMQAVADALAATGLGELGN